MRKLGSESQCDDFTMLSISMPLEVRSAGLASVGTYLQLDTSVSPRIRLTWLRTKV